MADHHRFYRLDCDVRHYAWGERGAGAGVPYIADLLGRSTDGKTPFAELWIGAHPSLPSRAMTDDGPIPLDALIASAPVAILGPSQGQADAPTLPFLLKVLSCERPLSIQAHPDKGLAAQLHRTDPTHYPDSNHKPEIAIALTPFEALCSFRRVDRIRADATRLPALGALLTTRAPEPGRWLRQAYAAVFAASDEAVTAALRALPQQISEAAGDTPEDRCFLKLLAHCPGDRGALSAYFLNVLHLAPGEAVFLAANEPHAYLEGTIIECMASSDNVVRAGLTGKFIDTETLLRMLTYSAGPVAVQTGTAMTPGDRRYSVPVPEFDVEVWRHHAGFVRPGTSAEAVSILLVLEGRAELRVPGRAACVAGRGSAWLWPACVPEATVVFCDEPTKIVRASPKPQTGRAYAPGNPLTMEAPRHDGGHSDHEQ